MPLKGGTDFNCMNMFENRRWLVIPSSMVDSLDFNEVMESSPDSLRYSNDGSKTFVKYGVNVVTTPYTEEVLNAETNEVEITTIDVGVYGRPSFYSEDLNEHTYSEIIELLSGPDWTIPLNKD